MAEYIEREALRDALYEADAITMNGIKILNQFPSSDVVPVKHGQWIGDVMGSSKLMPCKKCGYNRGRIIPYGHFQSDKITYRISCPKCSYCTKEKATVEEAIEAWNRRNNINATYNKTTA